MDQWRRLRREWGTSVEPLKKPAVPTVLAHCQFMAKNKQLTLLSQCKLAFIGRNVLMALEIRRDIKKNQTQRLFWPRSIHLCHQKPNPVRETVPLNCIPHK
jgi:hypothetical protein